MKLSCVSATPSPSPWTLRLNNSAWHTQSVLFLLKDTTLSLQILKKHKVLGSVFGVRGIERRMPRPNCRQWMVCWEMVVHRCRPLQGDRTERVAKTSVGELEPSQLGAENLVRVF